jgi:hypothetical protein
MKQPSSDIKNIRYTDDYIYVESYHFDDKTFSFEKPYNIDTVEYLKYLHENNHQNDILKLKEYLPNEIFEYVNMVIDHYNVEEYKDYSSGSRVNRSNRYHIRASEFEYTDINHDNFENFIKICKNILENNLNITYEEYIKNKEKIYTFKNEKDD